MFIDFFEVEARINHLTKDLGDSIDIIRKIGTWHSKLGHINRARQMDERAHSELGQLVDLWRLLDDLKAMAKEK